MFILSHTHLIPCSSCPILLSSHIHILPYSSHVHVLPCSSHTRLILSHVHLIPCSSHPMFISYHTHLIPCSSSPILISSHTHLIQCSNRPIFTSSMTKELVYADLSRGTRPAAARCPRQEGSSRCPCRCPSRQTDPPHPPARTSHPKGREVAEKMKVICAQV